MKCRFKGITDPGLLRSVNQDDYYIDPEGRYFIVADGMGGHAGGQEASQIATQAISSFLDEHWNSREGSQVLLEKAFDKANQAIIQDQSTHPERSDMGTTAVVVISRKQQFWCAHVGDSRLYRLRSRKDTLGVSSKLEQITEDHTWVGRAMKAGDLTPEQARTHPWRHVLSQCLGRKDLRHIDVQSLDVQPGDKLLLCSDGLTEELSDNSIAEYLQSRASDDNILTDLVKAAKEQGGRDNITIVTIAIDE